MTEEKIEQVKRCLEQMQIHLQNATALAEKLDREQLSEADDCFGLS